MRIEQAEVVAATDVRPEDVRIVVVDSRRERRQVIRQLLEVSFPPGEIAEADSRPAAVEVVDRCHPELVILEIQMPLEEGLDTITDLRLMSPPPRIVVCSFLRDAATIRGALDRGAEAYLTKPASAAQLRAAVEPVPAERALRHRPANERPVSPPPPGATTFHVSPASPTLGGANHGKSQAIG